MTIKTDLINELKKQYHIAEEEKDKMMKLVLAEGDECDLRIYMHYLGECRGLAKAIQVIECIIKQDNK